jgi:hypothetical protein
VIGAVAVVIVGVTISEVERLVRPAAPGTGGR